MSIEADRKAARVLLINADDRLLLFCMHDPDRPERGTWWITPGGGLEETESFVDAARRELFEETGIAADEVGPMIEEGVAVIRWGERIIRQHQQFYVVLASTTEIVNDGWEESEHRSTHSHRWWSYEEMLVTTETILPENLPELTAETIAIAHELRSG